MTDFKLGSIPRRFAFDIGNRTIWRIIYLLVVSGAVFLLRGDFFYDDPFITFRYARNLIQGLGFVYNPGERVLSTTSPFFALLLASLAPLWSDLPRVANLVSSFSIAAGGLLLFDIAGSLKSRNIQYAGLFLYPGNLLLLQTLGSEIPLYVTFCLAAISLYLRKDYVASAVFSALAVLVRPDGILVSGLLAVDFVFLERKSFHWKPALVFSAITISWTIFVTLYFGSPIPATLAAKQHQGMMAISVLFPEGFVKIFKSRALFGFDSIQIALMLSGLAWIIVKSRKWLPFLAWPVAYFLGYTLLGVTSYFWYYAPLVPGLVVCIGAGIEAITTIFYALISQFSSFWKERPSVMPLTAAGIVLVMVAIEWAAVANSWKVADRRFGIYHETGIWLRENVPDSAQVGMLEAGIIGYYSEKPVVDFAGLIQPSVADFLSQDTNYEDAAFFAIEAYQPEYLVLVDHVFPNLEAEFLPRSCDEIHRLEGNDFEYKSDLAIYLCTYP